MFCYYLLSIKVWHSHNFSNARKGQLGGSFDFSFKRKNKSSVKASFAEVIVYICSYTLLKMANSPFSDAEEGATESHDVESHDHKLNELVSLLTSFDKCFR